MPGAKWNVYLINRGERPLLYYSFLTDDDIVNDQYLENAADKALDGSDADGFLMLRSDSPIPLRWPGNR